MPELERLAVNLGATLGTAAAAMLVALAIGVMRSRHRVVDIFWGLGFAAIALMGLALSAGHGTDSRRWLATGLTVVWGLRLAAHLAWRSRATAEDPRYEHLLQRARGSRTRYALRMIYLLQLGLLWCISWPVQVAQYDPDGLTAFSWLGVTVWSVGFTFEAVADAQLHRFRTESGNTNRVLDTGLWRYTRHPNYFGDACVWWGLWLLAADSLLGLGTVVSPLAMTYLLARKTGKPLLEKHLLETRHGYADYVLRTSGFFPRPPRR